MHFPSNLESHSTYCASRVETNTLFVGMKIVFDPSLTILQTQVGGKLNRADTLRNRLSDKNLALEQFLETVEQVDYSDAVVEYQIQLNMLTAMLQTGARTMSPSLFNFM